MKSNKRERIVINDILEINRRLSFNLWYVTDVVHRPQGLSPRLILPKKRSGQIRISEQESRFLYCELLNTLNYYYSVETPTERKYQLTGHTPMSASSDLSLYLYNGSAFEKIANVEFKAHNPPKEQIRKDIEKLIREGISGNWFHTLKNIDNHTLISLFGKLRGSFKTFSKIIDGKKISIVFCFCVIEKKWGCIKHFHYDSSQGDFDDYVDTFFELEHTVKSGEIEVREDTEWYIFKADQENLQ